MNTETKNDVVTDEVVEAPAKDVPDPAATYNPSTRLSKKRDFIIERPGNVNYAAPGGSFPGSRIVVFCSNGEVQGLEPDDHAKFLSQVQEENEKGLPLNAASCSNLYFKHRANLLTVAAVPDGGDILVMFTNHLEGKKLAYFQKYSSLMAETMEKFEAEEEEREAKEAETAKAAAKEKDLLAELGKKCRDHNLLGKLKDIGEENEKLKKENKKLAKAAK